MIMIDALNYCEGATTKTTFTITRGNIFVKNDMLQEPGIIENIAQTAAVRAGFESKKTGQDPLLGFIGAIKDLKIYIFPKTGDILETTVIIKADVMDVTIIEGFSFCNGIKVAECEMKIFIKK